MKNFAFRHPFVTSLIVFLAIFIGVIVIVMLGGALMLGGCKPSINDPCDGALALVGLWFLVVPTSLILGIIGGISTLMLLMWKIETKEEQSYK
jgi:hypothetical protein